ncbi:MAG: right-handed parallel beta-helix repeat-containing protein [Roseimicrobium sp.]
MLLGLALLLGASATAAFLIHREDPHTRAVAPSAGGKGIQRAITKLGPQGGEIVLTAGIYECVEPIIIRSNYITLRGAGNATVLRLKAGANCPVLIIGDEAPTPRREVSGVQISDFTIDGNRTQQDMECWDGSCDTGDKTVIRSCGVVVRRATDVSLERLSISGCRSAGLVTEKGCRRLTIRELRASDNHFDGLACYETEESLFEGLHLDRNTCAGISTDLNFNRNLVSNVMLSNNGKQGIFMRDSRYNVFLGIVIVGSGEQGVFLAQTDKDPESAAVGNSFTALTVTGSKGPAFRVNDKSCKNNVMTACQFIDNGEGGLSEVTSGLVSIHATLK